METFFTVVGTHSDNAPPAMFNTPIGGGTNNAEETIAMAFTWEQMHPCYTVGYEGNPEHEWRIVDYAVSSLEEPAKNHPTLGYVILYYEPVNPDVVMRDCLPELLNIPEDYEPPLATNEYIAASKAAYREAEIKGKQRHKEVMG